MDPTDAARAENPFRHAPGRARHFLRRLDVIDLHIDHADARS